MIETLDYREVPFHFVHCFRSECPKADSCLRHQCKEYLSDEPVLYAYGMSKLFDELPYAKAKDIKDEVVFRIGKTQFYRMKNETIGISPLHQRAIKKVFLKYGIEADPVFDRYVPVYPWQ